MRDDLIERLKTAADGMLPDALAPVSAEWYQLCERAAYVDKIKISGELAEAIVAAVCAPAAVTREAAAALEAAREDSERLEYFVETGGQIVCRRDSYAFVDSHDGITDYFPTARQAIDQSRGKAGGEVEGG